MLDINELMDLKLFGREIIFEEFQPIKKGQRSRHLYTATYMNMTSSGLQFEVAY